MAPQTLANAADNNICTLVTCDLESRLQTSDAPKELYDLCGVHVGLSR
jgi:hypothetical protein